MSADRPALGGTPEAPPLLTIRVSRDGGRTYGPARVVPAGADLEPMLNSQWPPCQCPEHRAP